jgi:hypothetical protein
MRKTLTQTKTLHVRHEHSRRYDNGIKCSMIGRMTPLYCALASLLGIRVLAVKQPKLSVCVQEVIHHIVHVSSTDASEKVLRKLKSMPYALVDKKLIQMAPTNPKALDLVMETWMLVCVVNGEVAGRKCIEEVLYGGKMSHSAYARNDLRCGLYASCERTVH